MTTIKVKTSTRLLRSELKKWKEVYNKATEETRGDIPESYHILLSLAKEIDKLQNKIIDEERNYIVEDGKK